MRLSLRAQEGQGATPRSGAPSVVVGLLLIGSGLAKVFWPSVAGAPAALSTLVAVLEILLGGGLLVPVFRRPALAAALLLMFAFAGFNLHHVLGGEGGTACGCHGKLYETTHAEALIASGVLLGACAYARKRLGADGGEARERALRIAGLVAGALGAALPLLAPADAPQDAPGEMEVLTRREAQPGPPVLVGFPRRPDPVAQVESPSASVLVFACTQDGEAIPNTRVWWSADDSAPPESSALSNDAGTCSVRVRTDAGLIYGRTPEGAWASVAAGAGVRDVRLEFDRSPVLSGHLVDEGDQPLAGVPLVVLGSLGSSNPDFHVPEGLPFRDRAEVRRVRTSETGHFEVAGLESGHVTVSSEDHGIRLLAPHGRRRLRLPATDVMLRASRVAVRRYVPRDAETELPVPPLIRVRCSAPAYGVKTGIIGFSQLEGWVDILWPVAADGTPHPISVALSARGYEDAVIRPDGRVSDVSDAPSVDVVPMRRSKERPASGAVRIRLPAEYRRPQWCPRVEVLNLDTDETADVLIHEEEREWLLLAIPPGRYDVLFAGDTIAAEVNVTAERVTVAEGDFAGHVPILVRLGAEGGPVRGKFSVALSFWSPTGSGGGHAECEATEEGVVELGWHPAGRLTVALARATEFVEPAKIIVPAGSEAMTVDLVCRRNMLDLRPR